MRALAANPNTALLAAVTDLGRARQYEALLAVDEQLAPLDAQLEALGVAEDTMVLVLSDNGLGWGEHYYWLTKGSAYEESQRVPFTVRYPRRVPRTPSNLDTAALNIDIAPTVADLAGVTLPVAPDGIALTPWLTRAAPPPATRTDYSDGGVESGPR